MAPHFKTICEKTADRDIPQPTLYRMAVDGYHEISKIFDIFIRCKPGGTLWAKSKAREREAVGRKDEERERRDSPPDQRRESGPNRQNGTHVGN